MLLFVIAVASSSAQEPRFVTHAHEVVVPVTVTTKAGKPVDGLASSDFVLLSDNQVQGTRMVARDEGVPLSINAVIVLQTDAASEPALAKVKKTAAIVSSYITNDMGIGAPSVAAVITAGDEIRLAQPFTSDANVLDDAFAKLTAAGGSSRIVDGVSRACDLLAHRREAARRVIVLISEARDSDSQLRFPDVVLKAQQSDIVIYTISYSAFATAFTEKAKERPPPQDQPGLYDPDDHGGLNLLAMPLILAQFAKLNVADAFAEATGGAHRKFTTLRGLERQLTFVGTELHNRYTLTFTQPEGQSAGYHKLFVTLRKPSDWVVHARAGYWSAPD